MDLPKNTETTTPIEIDNSVTSKDAQKAKRILGDLANKLSNDELQTLLSETKFLVNSLLDDFEKMTFDGKTLQDVLYERNRK